MKKLLIAEMLAIAVSIVFVVIGSIMGWTHETITYLVAVVAVVTTVIGMVINGDEIVVAGVTANTAAYITALVGDKKIAAATVVALISITIFPFVFGENKAIKGLKVKHSHVLLSLLGESVTVSAILIYGPGLIRSFV